jgi:glycosidase
MRKSALATLLGLVPLVSLFPGVAAAQEAAPPGGWRSEVIYFALLDRFSNGDPANDTSYGESRCNDSGNPFAFQGGDLAGLANKIDYIRDLGATSVWISPLYKGVASMRGVNCGFPGYWANFGFPYRLEIDPRYGHGEEFDRVISGAHGKGMKVMLDLVVNHAG